MYVRRYRDLFTQPLQATDYLDELVHVVDRAIADRADDLRDFGRCPTGDLERKRQFLSVIHVQQQLIALVRTSPYGCGEPAFDLLEGVHDVFARADPVRTKVRARTRRLSQFAASQHQPVGLARFGAGDGVLGPRLRRVGGPQLHLFRSGSLLSLSNGTPQKLFLVQALQGQLFFRRFRQTKRCLFFKNQRECRSHLVVRGIRCVAAPFDPPPRTVLQPNGDDRSGSIEESQFKPFVVQPHLAVDVDLVLAAFDDQFRALFAQQLAG